MQRLKHCNIEGHSPVIERRTVYFTITRFELLYGCGWVFHTLTFGATYISCHSEDTVVTALLCKYGICRCLVCCIVRVTVFLCLVVFVYETVPVSTFIKHTGATCLSQRHELVAFCCKLASSVTKRAVTQTWREISVTLERQTYFFYCVFVVVCTVCHIWC